MTDKQILQKAIEKAEKNGWDKPYWIKEIEPYTRWVTDIIFSHSFAKSFWGEDENCSECGNPFAVGMKCGKIKTVERWGKELSIMVLEEEPLKYLEQFLDK